MAQVLVGPAAGRPHSNYWGFSPAEGRRIQIIGDFRRPKAGDFPGLGHFPGLGAEIAGAKFQEQFKSLATEPPIEYVKGKPTNKPNQIEAITGATISSKAVVNIINKTVEQWLEKNEK